MLFQRTSASERGEGLFLREEHIAPVAKAIPNGVGFDHNLTGAHFTCCGQQVRGSHIAQRVSLVHIAVAHRAVLRQSSQRMHNRISPLPRNGSQEILAVHHIGDNRLGAQGGQQAGFPRCSCDSKHLVPACDKGAHQGHTQSARCARNQYFHFLILSLIWELFPFAPLSIHTRDETVFVFVTHVNGERKEPCL